ncbi:CHAT domain-containing protein [Altericista sp. CCNU0014]|uniref:CHAT domain-containing protein n=1 Tax=Altericista sp. CCNU0014 TaxID=3082949 RepID=UPI00384E185E
MKPSPRRIKSSKHKVRSHFLFTLAFCLLPVTFCLPPHAPHLAIAQTIDARKAEGDRLFRQGTQQYLTSQYPAALNSWQQALQIYRAIKNRQRESTTLSSLGNIYRVLGNYDKAIEYGQQSLAIARAIQNRPGESEALVNLGLAYLFKGDYEKTIEYGQQSLAIARAIQNRRGEAVALGSLGGAYHYLGNDAKAIEYGQQKLAITRAIQDRQGEIEALNILGNVHLSLGNYTKAIEYGEQYLVITREIKNRYGESVALGNLAGAYLYLGNYAKAIEYEQQQLAIARTIKYRRGEAVALGNLGTTYRALGNYAKAIEYGEQSLAVAREIKDPEVEGLALVNLGAAYHYFGDDAKAIDYGEQSLAIARAIKNHYAEGEALGHLGIVYLEMGNYAKAIEYTQQFLAIARQINRQGEGAALGNLGLAYGYSGNNAKAITYIQQQLAITREIKDREGEGLALNNLGVTFLKAGNPTEAEKMLMRAIQVWESQRQLLGSNDANKISIFEGQSRTYRTLQQVRVAQNNPIAALEIAERGRARAFVDLLTQRLSSGDASPEIVPAPNQEQIRQIAKAQNATLVQYSIIYDTFEIQDKQVRRESALYIWVIQSTGKITFRQVDLKPLWRKHNASIASSILDTLESFPVRSRSNDSSIKPQVNFNLQRLHQLLIDPIANLLPKDPNAHVIFIPQGSLFQVPFPALQDANGTYLIQKHTILTAPSIQVLALTRQQRQKLANQPANHRGKALVLGNPTMPQVSLSLGEPKRALSPLPGAEAEARAIAPFLNTQAITGAQGTKAAIVQKMPQASMIHLATHGLLDDVRGLDSAIALAPSGKDDGLLTAEEIFDMKLQANLVVLSACNTGEGRITGDGVIGLSRSLIAAGVPSVIVSLWAVPDAPTAALMQTFYKNLQENPNKAQALRQAMLTTLKTHPQPRDWAAFTLIGEAE